MSEKITRIERVRVLHGHVSPETAYLKHDHPYGSLRCEVRFWVETATKGRVKGQQRFVKQTSNPKRPGRPWNKPHPSTYAGLAVMYLDGAGRVQWWGAGLWVSAVQDARMRLMGIYDQLDEDQRARYDAFVRVSQRNDSHWGEFDEAVTALAAEIAHAGKEPEFTTEGWTVWETPSGQRFSLGDPPDVQVHLAAARLRLEENHSA